MSRLDPWAVLIGLDCVTGLQTARILSGRGVRVVGIAVEGALSLVWAVVTLPARVLRAL